MKNFLLHLILLFGLTSNIYAQDDNKLSTLSFTPNQKTVPFRLFPTQSAKVFIKLNTRTGQLWQVDWSNDPKKRTLAAIVH